MNTSRLARLAVVVGIGVALGVSRLAAQNAPTPESMQLRAYTAVMEAEQARQSEQFGLAVRRYREALISYHALAGAFPEWRKDIVNHRLQATRQAILEIVERTGRSEEELAAEGVRMETVSRLPPERVAEALAENARLRDRVQALEAEVAAGPRLPPNERAMIESMSENLTKLATALQEARRQDRTSQLELMALARAADQGSKDMGRLLADLKESAARSPLNPEQMAAWFTEAEAKVQGRLSEQARALAAAAAAEQALRGEAELLRAEIRRRELEAGVRMGEIEAMQAGFTAQRADLDSALAEARREVAAAKALLAESGSAAAEWNREREALQGEVTKTQRTLAFLEEEMKILEEAYLRLGQRALELETQNRGFAERLRAAPAPEAAPDAIPEGSP